MDISGKITIITGASEGIGLATARRFSAAGAKVALVARSAEKLTALADELIQQGGEALSIPCDMRDSEAINQMVEQAFQHFGRLDILINNAGQSAAGTVAEMNLDDLRSILELNVFGPIVSMQTAVPKMRSGGGGLILNISSMVSKMNIPGLSAYAATKAALNLISGTARRELEAENIRVVTIFPRTTATDFGKHALGDQHLRQRQRSSASAHVVVDSPEFVAEKILEAARNEPVEQYMEEGHPE
jgi:short-subunit dehydrogenase